MTDDQLARAYLRRLRRATRGLPRARRQELMDQVTEHIAESRQAGGAGGLRGALERLGDPAEIAAATGAGAAAAHSGWREIVAVTLLLAGGLAGLIGGIPGAVAGWVPGVVLLWASSRWRWPDKLLGTLVWPGGLAAPVLLLSLGTTTSSQACVSGPGQRTTCTSSGTPGLLPGWLGIPLTVALAVAPVVVAVWLLRRSRRAAADPLPAIRA